MGCMAYLVVVVPVGKCFHSTGREDKVRRSKRDTPFGVSRGSVDKIARSFSAVDPVKRPGHRWGKGGTLRIRLYDFPSATLGGLDAGEDRRR